jgi:serine/threonine protein kinase
MPRTAPTDPCPDPDLLAGGRMPDPLRSRIAIHVAHCEACSAALEALSHPATGTPPLDARAPAFGGLAAITAAPWRFEIVRHLGAGGMGTVYEAFDREHLTRIALKVLRHVAPESLLRFKREFRSLQNLHHPNLVRLGELIGGDESWLFTMELVEGVRFLDHIRPAGAIGFDDARLRDAFGQLVDGLAALHAIGKVHRDVKPSNALVASNGRVVLLDLGLVLDDH